MSFVVNRDKKLYKGKVQASAADDYSIELITGSAVIDLILNPAFQKSWDKLYECCPWATVFQKRQFVTSWYQLYQQKHLPVLIKEEQGGQVTGLLPMVLLNASKNGRITGAGHYDAPYQTWLTAFENAETFIKKALTKLMEHFPGHSISFRFVPPTTPLNWIKDDNKWRMYSIVQLHTRPLIDFGDPGHVKLFQGKHFRAKFNRLKRLGSVKFDHISSVDDFESALNELTLMYDFRQGAMFNKNHFKDEPLKKEFLLELFRQQLLHVTVLKINDKIVAGVIAIAGKDGVHLAGINCHSPFNARWYSPGFIHFVMLSKQLSEEHTPYFDLTPGYDPYKESLANCYDEVKEWVISDKLPFRIKKKIRKWVHTGFLFMRIRPMTAELKLKKCFYMIKHWRSIMPAIKALADKKRKPPLYLIEKSTLQPGKITLQKDNLNDLLEFKAGKKGGLTRWDFLSDAMCRFEKAQHCFTWLESGRLLACAWFIYPDVFSKEKNNSDGDNAIVLQHIYCHSAATNRLTCFLHGVLNELAVISEKEACSSPIFISSKYKTLL